MSHLFSRDNIFRSQFVYTKETKTPKITEIYVKKTIIKKYDNIIYFRKEFLYLGTFYSSQYLLYELDMYQNIGSLSSNVYFKTKALHCERLCLGGTHRLRGSQIIVPTQ